MLLLISCLLLEPGKITQTCENAGCAEPNPDEPAQPEGTNEPDVNVDTGPPGTDADGDGHYAESTDCDDSSPFVYSGAAENDSSTACLEDKDGDGYGAETPVSPHAEAGTDCNDDLSTTFPNAAYNEPGFEEQCMNDRDGDGYLGPRDGGTDCDPNDGLTYPGSTAEEDGIDRDCDRKACTMPYLHSLEEIGNHAAMLVLNWAPVCEGVAFLPGYALTMRYCRQNSDVLWLHNRPSHICHPRFGWCR